MWAALALTVAWVMSATALAFNQLVLHGSAIGPGPFLGLLSLAVQTVMIALVARGNAIGRALVVVFFVLSALPLPMVGILTVTGAKVSAAYLAAGFFLKGIATLLLFTGDARAWFRGA